MRLGAVALAFAACATWFGATDALAEGQDGKARGAIVVALGEGSRDAAKPLARDVYRDEALRPTIEDTTARVLAGDPPAEGAPQNLRDLAQIRGTLTASTEDAAGRRLLASLGAEQHAEIVVAVSVVGERTIARVLRVTSAQYEPIELGPTVERTDAGAVRFSWPGATTTLRRLVAHVGVPQGQTPIAPLKKSAPAPPQKQQERVWYKSPWFWVPVGAVVAAGAAVLIASKVTEDDRGTVRLIGQVAP